MDESQYRAVRENLFVARQETDPSRTVLQESSGCPLGGLCSFIQLAVMGMIGFGVIYFLGRD